MPLYAVRPDERMTYTIGDATITYRRLSLTEHRALDAAHTTRGVRDVEAALVGICVACILGWDGYKDPVDDEPIPFTPQHEEAHRARVAALPVPVLTEVATLAQSAIGQREHDLGNLPNTSTVSIA